MSILYSLWRVSVYEQEMHMNPAWHTNVRAPSGALAVVCAMTRHPICHIGKITVEKADGWGNVTGDWTDE